MIGTCKNCSTPFEYTPPRGKGSHPFYCQPCRKKVAHAQRTESKRRIRAQAKERAKADMDPNVVVACRPQR